MFRRIVISGAAFCVAAVASLIGAKAADASSITVAIGHSNNGGCLTGSASGQTPQSISGSCVFNGEHSGTASALADYGLLGVFVNAQFLAGAFTNFNSASASASFLADGYVVTGPQGGTLTTSLNFDLGGFLQQTCLTGTCVDTARVIVTTGTTGSLGEVFLVNGATSTNGNYNLSGLVGSGGTLFLTTPSFTVTVGQPFSVAIDLQLSGEFFRADGSSINADLAHTLTYHQNGPVFNLPAGYTANGLNVTNNIYGTPAPTTPVPEPGAIGLVASGLVLAGVVARRKRR